MSESDSGMVQDGSMPVGLRDTMILDNIRDAVVVVGSNGNVSFWNPGAEKLFGWSKEEILGQPFRSRFPHDTQAIGMESLCERLRESDWDGEYEDYRKDGTSIWVEARIRRLSAVEGHCLGIVGIFHDITRRKHAETELREREGFVRSVLDSMASHTVVLDGQGTIVSCNRTWHAFGIQNAPDPQLRSMLDLQNRKKCTDLGCNYLEICRQTEGSERQEALRSAQGIEEVLRGRRSDFEMEYACDSPWERRFYSMKVTPLEGTAKGVVVSHTDITQRRLIERSISEHRERLQLALTAAKMAVWTLDLQTQQMTWSKEASELFPGILFDADPLRMKQLIHPDDLSPLIASLEEVMVSGAPQSCELRIFGHDQQLRWMSLLGQRCTDASGQPRSIVGTLQDVTTQRRSELLLLGQNQILDQIAKGVPLGDVLCEVARLVESLLHSVRCTIQTKEADEKTLRLVAAPSMPALFQRAVTTIPIGLQSSMCGECAFRGMRIEVTDITSHPLYEDYLRKGLPSGLRSCLSVPIVASDARSIGSNEEVPPRSVIGTIALYRSNGTPSEPAEEDAVLQVAAQLAAVAIERDLSVRRVTESEERYRRLLEVVPAAIVLSEAGRITFCNQTLLQVTGYRDRSELIGKSVRMLVKPEQLPELDTARAALLEGRIHRSSHDDYLLRSDGTLVPVQSVATVIRDNGRPAVLVALLDRTEQRRSDELLRSIMSSVSDAIITTDRSGRIVSANAATARLFDHEVSDLIGQNISLLLIPPSFEQLASTRSQEDLDASLRSVSSQELRCRQKSGRTFPADVTMSSFLLNQEPHFTRVVRDISARRKLEEQLRQSQKMDAIGQLAGGIAHDFNNLLTVINGYTDRLLDRLPCDDPLHDIAADVRAAGERAASLTSQLLAFSRRAIIEPKLLDLNQVVQSEVRMLRRLIGEHITIITQLRPDIPQIKIDPVQLEQLLLNLALNARDAMEHGGRLVISTSTVDVLTENFDSSAVPAPGRYVQLSVQDNGIGMTEEVKQRIFEPFFTTKGVGKGSGLGLATVYGVVHQAGGHISFESQYGKGSTFRVLLPVHVRESFVSSTSGRVEPPAGKETVLLAEDTDVVRRLIRQTLEMLGYTVIDAESGQQALAAEASHPGVIDLLLTDVVMSDFGGKTLADAICQKRPNVKVLFMSGYTDDALTRYGVESSQAAFLQKPFTAPTLARKVRDVLDNKHDN